MDPRRRVAANSLAGAVLYLTQVAVAFLISPILIHGLGNRDYGIWEVLLTFVGTFRLLELGLSPAVVRHVARAGDDRDRVAAVHHSAFAVLGLLGVGNLLLFALAALRPAPLFNVAPGAVEGLPAMVLLGGGVLSVQFLGIPFTAVLTGRQRHALVYGLRIAITLVQAYVFWRVLEAGGGLRAMALALFLTNLAEYGTHAVLVAVSGASHSLLRPRVSRTVLGELYGFGFDSVTLMFAERLRKWSIPLVISQVLGPAQVVFFAQPAKLVDYGLALLNQVRQPLMPYFSSLGGTGSRGAWFALSRALQTPLFLVAVSVYFLGEPFIGRWIGPEYAVAGRDVIRILALGMVAEGIAGASGSLLVAEARHGRPARIAVALSVVHVGASVLLAHRIGLAGVAASLAVVNVLTGGVMLVAASRLMETTAATFLRSTALRFLPATAAAAAVHLGIALRRPPEGYLDVLVAGAVGAAVYLPLAWFLGFTANDRRALRALGPGKRP